MANVFQAAMDKAANPPSTVKAKKGSIVLVSDPDTATAIDEYVKADAAEKQAKADKEVVKGVVTPFCRHTFIEQFAGTGRKPDTLKFRTSAGNGVTLVVQDRGERYSVPPEQLETLRALLGDEKLQRIVLDDLTFSFNNDILNKPGVMAALGEKVGSLVKDGILSGPEAEKLLVATPRTTIRKGVVDDLARLCDNNIEQMEDVLAALGSHCSSYIKA